MKHFLIKEVYILPINKSQSIYFNVVPKLVEENTVSIGSTFIELLTIVQFNIPVRTIATHTLTFCCFQQRE